MISLEERLLVTRWDPTGYLRAAAEDKTFGQRAHDARRAQEEQDRLETEERAREDVQLMDMARTALLGTEWPHTRGLGGGHGWPPSGSASDRIGRLGAAQLTDSAAAIGPTQERASGFDALGVGLQNEAIAQLQERSEAALLRERRDRARRKVTMRRVVEAPKKGLMAGLAEVLAAQAAIEEEQQRFLTKHKRRSKGGAGGDEDKDRDRDDDAGGAGGGDDKGGGDKGGGGGGGGGDKEETPEQQAAIAAAAAKSAFHLVLSTAGRARQQIHGHDPRVHEATAASASSPHDHLHDGSLPEAHLDLLGSARSNFNALDQFEAEKQERRRDTHQKHHPAAETQDERKAGRGTSGGGGGGADGRGAGRKGRRGATEGDKRFRAASAAAWLTGRYSMHNDKRDGGGGRTHEDEKLDAKKFAQLADVSRRRIAASHRITRVACTPPLPQTHTTHRPDLAVTSLQGGDRVRTPRLSQPMPPPIAPLRMPPEPPSTPPNNPTRCATWSIGWARSCSSRSEASWSPPTLCSRAARSCLRRAPPRRSPARPSVSTGRAGARRSSPFGGTGRLARCSG